VLNVGHYSKSVKKVINQLTNNNNSRNFLADKGYLLAIAAAADK